MRSLRLLLLFTFLSVSHGSADILRILDQTCLFALHQSQLEFEKSGTPRLFRLLHENSATAREFQAEYFQLSRPELDRYSDSSDGRFRVHYNISGSNAPGQTDADGNGTPDYVDSTLVYLEYAWTATIGLGFEPPRSDLGRGGSDAVDVYIQNLARTGYALYGYVSPDNNGDVDSAYMVIDNDFLDPAFSTKGFDALKVTTAHEFFHIQHYSCYGNESVMWWMDQTAVWFEDYVWDGVNDYLSYLEDFLWDREIPLDNSSARYSTALFAFMLAGKYTPDIILTLWNSVRDNQSGNIWQFDSLIPGGLSQALSDLGVWMFFTGGRANPSTFFKDSPLFPCTVSLAESLSVDTATDSLFCPRLTFKYIGIAPPSGLTPGTALSLNFSDRTGGRWNIQAILFNSPDDFEVRQINSSQTILSVDRPFREAILVISNASPGVGSDRLVYSIGRATAVEKTVLAFALEQNHPNPFNMGTVIRFTVSVPSPVQLRVINSLGQTVRVLVNDRREQGTHRILFDGAGLSSGVYYAVLESGQTVLTRKMLYLK